MNSGDPHALKSLWAFWVVSIARTICAEDCINPSSVNRKLKIWPRLTWKMSTSCDVMDGATIVCRTATIPFAWASRFVARLTFCFRLPIVAAMYTFSGKAGAPGRRIDKNMTERPERR
jgi:hypothetical protein